MLSRQYIPLYTDTSNSWGKNQYAVNLDTGINEYMFGRPTPNNHFMVASSTVRDQNNFDFQMKGAGKKAAPKKKTVPVPQKKETPPKKKTTTTKKTISPKKKTAI